MIRVCLCSCETHLDEKIVKFKQNRARYPVYKLGWLEAYTQGKNMAVHDELLAKCGPQTDCGPPKKAMQFREFLRGCKFTAGGFLRKDLIKKRRNGRGGSDCGSSTGSSCSLPSIASAQPPPHLYIKKKEYDACGREKKINPVLVNKYSELLFREHVNAASNENVRSLYTETNEQEEKLPSMAEFMRTQGMDLSKMESQLSQTATPFGLYSVEEEDEGEIQEVWDQHHGTRQLSMSAPPNRTISDTPDMETSAPAVLSSAPSREGDDQLEIAAKSAEADETPTDEEKVKEAPAEAVAPVETEAAAKAEARAETEAAAKAEAAAEVEAAAETARPKTAMQVGEHEAATAAILEQARTDVAAETAAADELATAVPSSAAELAASEEPVTAPAASEEAVAAPAASEEPVAAPAASEEPDSSVVEVSAESVVHQETFDIAP